MSDDEKRKDVDILAALDKAAIEWPHTTPIWVLSEACDEIERLRASLKEALEALDMLMKWQSPIVEEHVQCAKHAAAVLLKLTDPARAILSKAKGETI